MNHQTGSVPQSPYVVIMAIWHLTEFSAFKVRSLGEWKHKGHLYSGKRYMERVTFSIMPPSIHQEVSPLHRQCVFMQ